MFFNKKNYKLEITGRAGLLYKEDKKSMKIDSEMLAGSIHDVVIYTDSINQWNPPFENEFVSKNDKDRILSNVKMDLESNSYKVDMA